MNPSLQNGSLHMSQEEEEQEAGGVLDVAPEPTDEELLAQLGLQLEQQIADLTGKLHPQQSQCSNMRTKHRTGH